MTLFPIDPAARAIIESLETEPERWRDSDRYLTLGDDVKLSKYGASGLVILERPRVNVSRRSQRALWAAYERWEAGRRDTAEKRARAELTAALARTEPA